MKKGIKKYCFSLFPPLLCGASSLYIATAFSLPPTDELQKRLAICFFVFFVGLLFAYLKKTADKKISTENHSSAITFILSFIFFIITAGVAANLAKIMDSGSLLLPVIVLIALVSALFPLIIFNVINGKGAWKKLAPVFIEIIIEYLILPLVIAWFVFIILGDAGKSYYYGMGYFTVIFILILGSLVSTIDILSYSTLDGIVSLIQEKLFL